MVSNQLYTRILDVFIFPARPRAGVSSGLGIGRRGECSGGYYGAGRGFKGVNLHRGAEGREEGG